MLSSMNGGLEGAGRCASFIVSICSAFDIVGRNEGISWVHRSPICTTLKIASLTSLLWSSCDAIFGSNSSSAVPDWKCFQVWLEKVKLIHFTILS